MVVFAFKNLFILAPFIKSNSLIKKVSDLDVQEVNVKVMSLQENKKSEK